MTDEPRKYRAHMDEEEDRGRGSSSTSKPSSSSSSSSSSRDRRRDRSRDRSPRRDRSDKDKSSKKDAPSSSSSSAAASDATAAVATPAPAAAAAAVAPAAGKDAAVSSSSSSGRDKDKRDRSPRRRSSPPPTSSSSSSSSSRRRRSPSRSPPRHSSRSSRSGRRSSRSRSRDRRSSRSSRTSRRSSRSRSRTPPRRKRSRSKSPPKAFNAEAVQNTLKAVSMLNALGANGVTNLTVEQMLLLNNQGGSDPATVQQMLATQMQAANPQLTRQARRLYVGNLPVGMGLTEKMLTDFFNATVISMGIATPQPVLSSWLSSEGTFCFVEFRGVQDCTTCIGLLQGLTLGGRSLRIGRPADYKAPPPHLVNFVVGFPPGVAPPPNTGAAANVSLTMLGGMAVGLPMNAMNAINGGLAGATQLPSIPSVAGMGMNPYAGLPGLPAGFNPAALAAAAAAAGVSSLPSLPSAAAAPSIDAGPPTKVLLLLNMVQESELSNDDEFADIIADVRDECSKHGNVTRVIIPRPFKAGEQVDDQRSDFGPCSGIGTGRIFVHYETETACAAAQAALNGRTFNANRVVASFYEEGAFENKVYSLGA